MIAMKFLEKEGIKTVNISNDDITNGRLKLILGLVKNYLRDRTFLF